MKLPSKDLAAIVQAGKYAMRIAQVSPLIESVPPKGYGGTERVVSYLTEELVARGHEVTLFQRRFGDASEAGACGRPKLAQQW